MTSQQEHVIEMLQKIRSRQHMYGLVSVSCYLRREKNSWINITTFIRPLSIDAFKLKTDKLNYGDFMLLKTTITLKELMDIVQKFSEPHLTVDLKIGDVTFSVQEACLNNYHRCYSYNWYDIWGFDEYSFKPKQDMYYREDTLVSVDLPLFPDFGSILKKFFEINRGSYNWSDFRGLFYFLPEYSVRIKPIEVKKSEKNVEQTELRLSHRN
jgi:hypothetical protein